MPRVIAFLVLAFLTVLAVGLLSRTRSRHRDTFRPKRRTWTEPFSGPPASAPDSSGQTVQVVEARELEGVRDALSSAAIDPLGPIYRCGGCLAFYQGASFDALLQSNRGCCASCGSTDLTAVSVAFASGT